MNAVGLLSALPPACHKPATTSPSPPSVSPARWVQRMNGVGRDKATRLSRLRLGPRRRRVLLQRTVALVGVLRVPGAGREEHCIVAALEIDSHCRVRC